MIRRNKARTHMLATIAEERAHPEHRARKYMNASARRP